MKTFLEVSLLVLFLCAVDADLEDEGYPIESDVDRSVSTEEPFPCNYPDIDFLSDSILERLAYSEEGSVLLNEYQLEDDNKGTVNARNIKVYNLNKFQRREGSTYSCTDKGLSISIPIKWYEPLRSNFEVAPGFTRNPSFYVKASGIIHTIEANAIIDVVFVGEPSAHLTSITVTNLRDVEVGPIGDGFFARSARKVISLFANEFKQKMRRAVEGNLQEILDSQMVKLNMQELGFQ